MRRYITKILFIQSMLISLLFAGRLSFVDAARGTPGSVEFGYGGVLNPRGAYLEQAVQVASNLQFDWLLIPINWSFYYPTPDSQPDFSTLDRVVTFANQNQISLVFSFSGAPEWALTPQGPNPPQTNSFIISLLQRYAGSIAAIEVFPGANTVQGWGTIPDPADYAALYASLYQTLQEQGISILMVAGGLEPIRQNSTSGDMDDIVFLQGLYAAGLKDWMPVISVRLSGLTGDALQPATAKDRYVLRHYEEIRQVMLNHQHDAGLIWITSLSSPVTIARQSQEAQTIWLSQAYHLLRAQLFVGVVFLDAVNPDIQRMNQSGFYLVVDDHNYHPFYTKLRSLIAENSPDVIRYKRGRPKAEEIVKPQ
ncbi:MAG: hypothetical protein WHV66_12335 [Anaerolineales bacterium]